MDGKIARQLLFKKKLEEENREAEERLRASLKHDKVDKVLKALAQEKRRLIAEKKTLESKLEKLKSAQKSLQQEEAIQKILEIKIQNAEIERVNRITEITKRLSLEEQKIKKEEEDFINAQLSVKLERKTYLEIQARRDSDVQEIEENQNETSNGNKGKKAGKRAQKETEERKQLLRERAERLKKKRADRLKEQLNDLKIKNAKTKDELEREKRVIENSERKEKDKHKSDRELITKNLANVTSKIVEAVLAITDIDSQILKIEDEANQKKSRTVGKKWV